MRFGDKSLRERAVRVLERRLDALPSHWKEYVVERALRFLPIAVILRIPCSYANYIQCHRPGSGEVVIDCGAHVGLCSVLFARLVGPHGRVVALEPFPDSHRRLVARIERLGLTQVVPMALGVWDSVGRVQFRQQDESVDNAVVFGSSDAEGGGSDLSIDVSTLDAIVESLGLEAVALIKMDIEGAELEAIGGAARTVSRFTPAFAVASYHVRDGAQTSIIVQRLLREHGYRVTEHEPHRTTCGIPRPS